MAFVDIGPDVTRLRGRSSCQRNGPPCRKFQRARACYWPDRGGFGTSAPELTVSIRAVMSGQAELAIANVVGGSIFNILFILGLAAVISLLTISVN